MWKNCVPNHKTSAENSAASAAVSSPHRRSQKKFSKAAILFSCIERRGSPRSCASSSKSRELFPCSVWSREYEGLRSLVAHQGSSRFYAERKAAKISFQDRIQPCTLQPQRHKATLEGAQRS